MVTSKTTWFRKGTAVFLSALGMASLLIGGLASPAGAQVPTAISSCGGSPTTPTLTAFVSSFPPSETFFWFGYVHQPDGVGYVYNGFTITTDETGIGGIGVAAGFSGLPLDVVFAVYRDTNGNRTWNPAADDTVYVGSGTVTDCPRDVTLAPK
jgi:hypothetical protein